MCGPVDDQVLGGGGGKAAATATRKLMHRVCTYFLQQVCVQLGMPMARDE